MTLVSKFRKSRLLTLFTCALIVTTLILRVNLIPYENIKPRKQEEVKTFEKATDLNLPPVRDTRPINLTSEITSLIATERKTCMFRFGNITITLNLAKNHLFAGDATPPQGHVYYKGMVAGYPHSNLRLTLDKDMKTLDGYINFGDTYPTYYLESSRKPSKEVKHMIYREDGREMEPSLHLLPQNQEEQESTTPLTEGPVRDGGEGGHIRGNMEGGEGDIQLDIHLDTNWKPEDTWRADINNIDGIYERELGLDVTIVEVTTVSVGASWPTSMPNAFAYAISYCEDYLEDDDVLEGDNEVLLTDYEYESGWVGWGELPADYTRYTKRGDCWWSLAGDERRDKILGAHEIGHNYNAKHEYAESWTENLLFRKHTIMYYPYTEGFFHTMVSQFSDTNALRIVRFSVSYLP